MNKMLSLVTHAIVSVPTQKDAKASNTYAMVTLCFGPGDDTALSGFRYTRNEEGKPMWQVPMFDSYRDERHVSLPVFKGALFLDCTRIASASVAAITKQLGKSSWGKQYHVFKDRVEEIDLPKE
jgi:hypothetical protein